MSLKHRIKRVEKVEHSTFDVSDRGHVMVYREKANQNEGEEGKGGD